MEYNTSELCDIYQDMVGSVLEPMLCSFGGRTSSAASSPTVKCWNRTVLSVNWSREAGVLVACCTIDGGAPCVQPLAIDSEIATTAAENDQGKGWSVRLRP